MVELGAQAGRVCFTGDSPHARNNRVREVITDLYPQLHPAPQGLDLNSLSPAVNHGAGQERQTQIVVSGSRSTVPALAASLGTWPHSGLCVVKAPCISAELHFSNKILP